MKIKSDNVVKVHHQMIKSAFKKESENNQRDDLSCFNHLHLHFECGKIVEVDDD